MKGVIFAILIISLLINCNHSKNKTTDNNKRDGLVPEKDSTLKVEDENQKKTSQLSCAFSDPDTSVTGIKIRNIESTLNVLGRKTKLEGDSTHIFYSSDKKQKLGLTVHSGDFYSQVSIFTISYSGSFKQNFQQINSKEFETEKGIKLGVNKKQIIEKLGMCYVSIDSTSASIQLNYKLQFPRDSRTKLLKNNNMPIYYATYRLKNDKLYTFEFGFEYP